MAPAKKTVEKEPAEMSEEVSVVPPVTDAIENTNANATEPAASLPTEKAIAPVPEEKVEVFIPKGFALEDPNYFVSVNGKSYILPRGKHSMVPKHVADEIRRSQRAQERFDALADALQGAAEPALNSTK